MPLLVKDYHNRINEYYRQAQSDYELIWHLKTHHCLHYGYWQPGTRTLREALMRMSDQVAIYGEIKPGDRAVDLGCGVGGPAVLPFAKIPLPDRGHFHFSLPDRPGQGAGKEQKDKFRKF